MRRQFDDPWSNPAKDAQIIRTAEGKIAAYLRIYANPKPEIENVAIFRSFIAPDFSNQGLEKESIIWFEARAKQRLAEIDHPDHIPKLIRAEMSDKAHASIQRYQNQGFTLARTFNKMERNLNEPISNINLPTGFILRTYDKTVSDQVRLALNETFHDHWQSFEWTPEEWPFMVEASNMRADLTPIVMDGNEVVAFCINYVNDTEKTATIESLGTRHAWRGKGLASVLLTQSMLLCKAAGLVTLKALVDSDSMTNAQTLYERLGFKSYSAMLSLEKRFD